MNLVDASLLALATIPTLKPLKALGLMVVQQVREHRKLQHAH